MFSDPHVIIRVNRVLSRLPSIRLPEPDIALTQQLAGAKGLPYQTDIKSLLHEALEREARHRRFEFYSQFRA